MKITLLDGTIKEFGKPLTVKQVAENLAVSLGKNTIGGYVNKHAVNIDYLIDSDVTLELVTSQSTEKYEQFLNNTSGFITAVAVKKLYPNVWLDQIFVNLEEAEFAITLDIEPRLKLEMLTDIQLEANRLLKAKKINYFQIDLNKANELFINNKYQMLLAVEQFSKFGFINVYELDEVYLISNHPLILELDQIKIIEIQQLTGSYWLDDAKNIMLQRIHGMGASSVKKLEIKKINLEERRSRDHRVINKQLNIFGFDNLIGAGLPLWLPNGVIIKDEIKKYLKQKEWEYDYIQVQTPVIGTVDLYKTSGHWDHYRDDMFQPFNGAKGNEEQFVLRPMNCPHHVAIYKQEQRSYRDLPLRFAEHALQHRYESSGSLTGLERVRAMELTDSHIFVRPDQVKEEFKNIYQLISEILKTFNIEIDYLSFSVRDPEDKEKYFPDDEMWNNAESELENVLKELNLSYTKMVGEAAFYGPKLDIQIKTAQNHEITVSTIQLDFLLPNKFDVNYIDKNQTLQRPIMIHRGLIGTYERFMAILLEQTKGVLPLWLAPTQIIIIPIGDETNFNYANNLRKKFKKEFIRTKIDSRDERLSWKIREAQINKIPYQLVIGDRETADETITYRQYGSEKQLTISQEHFFDIIRDQIKFKK